MDIAVWLRDLGLERYETAFRDNEIDQEALPKLTAEDLKDLGVVLGSHRRRLLDAIAALQMGAVSGSAPDPTPTQPADPGPGGAERRQLTVMFCDLVGSTALSSQLDPEDLREVIGAYHNCVAKTVGGLDGFVAKYMGDGVLIYFGYPRAHENDAERAVMAALKLVGAVAALRPHSTADLSCRVGIATGLVVVGDLVGSGEAQERGVVGETPNLAARLQTLAEPNTVMISDATRRLVGDLFDYRDLGAVAIRGLPDAVRVWQALRPSAVESRFEALRAASLSPLVGRDEEIELLLRRWSRAKTGEGQTALLSGEPGIGKSRIVAALQERLGGEPHTRIRYFCSPHHSDSPLHPFAAQLERAADFSREDSPAAKFDKLEALLAQSDENPAEAVALIADLLGVPADGRYSPLPAEPQRRRQQTLAALLRQLDGLARGQPVLLIFEDAHWIDSTSLELLDLVVDRVRRLPVLLVITFRPEFVPPWAGQAQVAALALSRLGSSETETLVNAIGGGKSFPPGVLDRIVARTDGIPLFVEELTKTVLESGLLREEAGRYLADGAVPELAIPSSLQDSLMARLDRLAPVKEVAQTGAALGREFSYELLAAVARRTEEQLRDALDQLVAAGLIFGRGSPPNATYLFKHALVQDAAYSTLLRGSRQELHARIAKVLEHQFPEIGETQPELLAHHFTEAGLVDRAAEYWVKAGEHALARSAMKEAEALLRKGLGLVHNMADGVSRQEQELRLQICLGQALFATQGWAAPGVTEAYDRARELCRQLDQPQKMLPILYGQWINHAMRGEMDRAQQLASEIRQLGGDRGDRFADLMGRWSGGFTSLHLGDFADARFYLEDGIALFDPVQRHQYLQLTPIDALVFLCTQLSLAQACLGFLDRARSRRDLGATEARRLGHAHTLAAALYFCLRTGWAGRLDPIILLQEAEELLALSDERGFAHWSVQAVGFQGWCLAASGRPAQGIPLLTAGLERQRAIGSTLYISHGLTMLADAYRIGGASKVGLAQISEAERLAKATGVKWVLAETLRLRGDLLAQTGDRMAAEASYRDGIALAQRQGGKLFELRAAVSLAGLWRDQGKRAEPRDLLAPILGWFTEGFETADLKEAKELLDEL
jgi:class 3 adenylate cyclase/predicted ATPase